MINVQITASEAEAMLTMKSVRTPLQRKYVVRVLRAIHFALKKSKEKKV